MYSTPLQKVLFVLTIMAVTQSCSSKKMRIIPLYPYQQVHTNANKGAGKGKEKSLFKYFFVENWTPHDSGKVRELKNFAVAQLDSNYSRYYQYEIHFYKRTEVLNEKFDSTSKDEIAWHQKDVCALAQWYRGKLFFTTYENGKFLDCGR
jgi:hypothetical protein